MPSAFQLLFNSQPVDDQLYEAISSVEVEENLDLPDAIQLMITVDRSAAGEPDFPSDPRLRPFSNVAVVVTPEGGADACIFDGFVLSHKLYLQSGLTGSTLEVWGQDSSWLMNLDETVREWVNLTDAEVASSIFGHYGITPSDSNSNAGSPRHPEDGHSLMQRGSDIRFLRELARRNGKVCRVACIDKPGQRIGYFCTPNLDGEPVAVIALNDPLAPTVESLELQWDVARPCAVHASQALFTDNTPEGISADTTDSGLPPLGAQDLGAFAGKTMTVLLSAPVDDAGELAMRAQSVLREGGWFVRCEGEAELTRLGTVLRVNTLVRLDGLGALHSGTYLVWSVRHTITREIHRMHFVLYRNAMGPSPSSTATPGDSQ